MTYKVKQDNIMAILIMLILDFVILKSTTKKGGMTIMKVSMLNYEMLSEEERYLIVMSNIYDVTKTALSDSSSADLIIVLGGSPRFLRARVIKMMELVKMGYSQNVLLSGGKGWLKLFIKKDEKSKRVIIDESEKEELFSIILKSIDNNLLCKDKERILDMSEADLMKLMIISNGGLPGAKIFHEPFSYNTKQNIEYAKALLDWLLKTNRLAKLDRIIIVTASYHCKRALLNFKKYFSDVDIKVCYSTEDLKELGVSFGKEMLQSEYYRRKINQECDAIINYSRKGFIYDAELSEIVSQEVAKQIEAKHMV